MDQIKGNVIAVAWRAHIVLAGNAISCESRTFFAARDDSPQHRFIRRSSRGNGRWGGHAQDRALCIFRVRPRASVHIGER